MKILLPMKNLIFSKKYFKTKLGILTLIVTVAYHYLNKDKSLYDGMKQGMDSELKNDSKKDEELSGYAFDDEYTAENIPDESPYDENDAIISSEWILEYWNSIRNRKPAINVPQLSQGIISDSKIRKLDISEFLDSQIVQDVFKFYKDRKWYDKNGFNVFNIAKDFCVFSNIPYNWCVDRAKDAIKYAKETRAKSKEKLQSGWSKFKNGVSYLFNGFLGLFTTSAKTETNAVQIEENGTQLNTTYNNAVQNQDGANNTMPNNAVQQDKNNNNTSLDTTVNEVAKQDKNNNDTMPNTSVNEVAKQDKNNNDTSLDTTHNGVAQQDTNNNNDTSLDTTLSDENIFEQWNAGFMVKIMMFFAESYESIKSKWHQISSYVRPRA